VLAGAFESFTTIPRASAGWAWGAFLGAALGLVAALTGGWFGATYRAVGTPRVD
jgi:hypothetical protein